MNLPLFLKKVDSLTKDMSRDELGVFIHKLARTWPGERREDFLEQLKTDVSAADDKRIYENLDIAAKSKIIDELHRVQDVLIQIDEGELCLTSEINEEYDDWYNSSEEEFLFEDPEDILGTIDTAIDLIHRCVDMEMYEEGCSLARQLSVIEVQDEGEYDACVGEVLDVNELNLHKLLSSNYDQLCKDSLYLVYKGNKMEYRADELYRMMDNLSCWYLSLEDVLQNGQEELDLFEEFLDLWIEYLDSQQGRHTDRLIQEAQSLMNNEEKELENARKYADRYPALYEQYLKNSYKTGEDLKFFEIGWKALAEVSADSKVRSRIALLTAEYAWRIYKADEAEQCWVEAFRSEKEPVNYFRVYIESRDYSRYEKEISEICASMNRTENEDYYTILFLNGRFKEVLMSGMNTGKPLGWSFTFMKKGLRLFLLYLYRGNDELPIGLRHMCKDVVSDLAFSEKRYCRGLRDSKDKGDGDFNLFWKCFREWKEKNVMSEEEQLEVMERLEHLIEIRVDGIMGANRRNYYGECAAFIAACGEVKESWGEEMGKQRFMDMHRQRYPRRSAFRQELQALGYRG